MKFHMIEFGCEDCGTTLIAIASRVTERGLYPTEFLTCQTCGAAWEHGPEGCLVKTRERLIDA